MWTTLYILNPQCTPQWSDTCYTLEASLFVNFSINKFPSGTPLDIKNTGTLQLDEMKEAFKGSGMKEAELDEIFRKIDFNQDNEINYSEFLAACLNKDKVVTVSKHEFAFHHFDVDNSGFITAQNLMEVFKRQGQTLTEP